MAYRIESVLGFPILKIGELSFWLLEFARTAVDCEWEGTMVEIIFKFPSYCQKHPQLRGEVSSFPCSLFGLALQSYTLESLPEMQVSMSRLEQFSERPPGNKNRRRRKRKREKKEGREEWNQIDRWIDWLRTLSSSLFPSFLNDVFRSSRDVPTVSPPFSDWSSSTSSLRSSTSCSPESSWSMVSSSLVQEQLEQVSPSANEQFEELQVDEVIESSSSTLFWWSERSPWSVWTVWRWRGWWLRWWSAGSGFRSQVKVWNKERERNGEFRIQEVCLRICIFFFLIRKNKHFPTY